MNPRLAQALRWIETLNSLLTARVGFVCAAAKHRVRSDEQPGTAS